MSQPTTEPAATPAAPVPTPPAATPPPAPEPDPKPDRTFTQAELDQIIAKRLSKYSDYDDAKTKAAEFDKLAEAQKTELQKAQERAEKAETAAQDALRKAFAAEKGVPAGLITGKTQQEWEAAAAAALEWKGHQAPQTPPPSFTHALGNTGTPPAGGDIDAQIAEAEKSRNFALSIRLKNQKAAQAAART